MSSVIISGNTSGAITLSAPAVAGTNTITLPASTGTVLTTGSPQSGGVIQVQSYDFTGAVTSTSSAYTLLTASFTPKFATSKVLALMTTVVERQGGGSGNYLYISLFRNGATISGQWANALGYQYTNNARCVGALNYLDSPATTSAISYTYSGDFGQSGNVPWQFYQLNLILLEIAG
jgi:hypothetical protein